MFAERAKLCTLCRQRRATSIWLWRKTPAGAPPADLLCDLCAFLFTPGQTVTHAAN